VGKADYKQVERELKVCKRNSWIYEFFENL